MMQGAWAVVQNCQHAPDWLSGLSGLLDTIGQAKDTHAAFRLWCVTGNCVILPVSALERSVKVLLEAPADLKAAALNCLSAQPVSDAAFYNGCPKRCARPLAISRHMDTHVLVPTLGDSPQLSHIPVELGLHASQMSQPVETRHRADLPTFISSSSVCAPSTPSYKSARGCMPGMHHARLGTLTFPWPLGSSSPSAASRRAPRRCCRQCYISSVNASTPAVWQTRGTGANS